MALIQHPDQQNDVAEKMDLLCLAAELVLESGGETYRVEETAMRMAKGFGLEHVNVAAFPTSIFIEAQGQASVRRIRARGSDMTRLARVNDVSRRVEQGGLSVKETRRLLEGISMADGNAQWIKILGSALAAASFSLLFGGSAGTFCVAFFIGMLVQAMTPIFARMEMGVLFMNFVGGLLTALIAEALARVIPYGSANAVIAGGIMPLLSGLLMTNAVRDTMYGDLISGVTRAVEALLIAATVALGVFVGLSLFARMGGALL